MTSYYNKNRLFKVTVVGLSVALMTSIGFLGCTQKVVVKPKTQIEKPKTAPELFEEGKLALNAGRYEDAAKAFKKATTKDNKMTDAYFLGGVSYEKLHKFPQAIAAYNRLLALNPNHIEGITNLALLYANQNRHREAERLYEKGLKNAPYNIELLNLKASALRSAKKYKESIETVRKILSRFPKDPAAYKTLSLIYFDQGNFEMAELIMGNAIKISPTDASLVNNLGMVYIRQKERIRAIDQFKKAIEIDPNYVLPHLNMAAIALQYRDYPAAIKHYSKVLQVEMDNQTAKLFIGYCYVGAGNNSEGIKSLENWLKNNPKHANATYYLALAYKNSYKNELAMKTFKSYMRLRDADPQKKQLIQMTIFPVLEQAIQAKNQPPPKEEKHEAKKEIGDITDVSNLPGADIEEKMEAGEAGAPASESTPKTEGAEQPAAETKPKEGEAPKAEPPKEGAAKPEETKPAEGNPAKEAMPEPPKEEAAPSIGSPAAEKPTE